MAKDASPRAEMDSFFDKAFEPYALEIGFLVREWNYFQEKMCDLFSTILGRDKHAVAAAIWYAIQNDRQQRRILLEAARATFKSNSKILEAIEWINKHAITIGSQRDEAVHSPISLMLSDPPEFIALYFHGHPLANKLKGKKLLEELTLYRKRATILKEYAIALESYIRRHRGHWDDEKLSPLPDKPTLPSSEPKKKTATHSFG